MFRISIVIAVLASGLSACVTASEPEAYMHLSCSELKSLADISRSETEALDLFGDRDINEMGRTNSKRDNGLRDATDTRDTQAQNDYQKQQNSVRAAYAQKGCS